MNLSELQAECGRLLSDPNNTRWSADVLTARLNRAQNEVIAYASLYKNPVAYTPISGQQYVSLPQTIISVIRASLVLPDGTIKILNGINREELDYRYPDWQNWNDGEPIMYFWDGVNRRFNMVPAPDDLHAITDSLTIWEVDRLDPGMVDPTDVPYGGLFSLREYHMVLVHWAVAYCWMDDGTPESLAKSHFHRSGDMSKPGQYELELKRIMDTFDVVDLADYNILWKPEGGRIGTWGSPSKSFPLR